MSRLATLVLLPLVLGLLAPSGPAQASVTAGPLTSAAEASAIGPGDRCRHAGRYTFTIRDVHRDIKVGYAKRFYLSPGETIRTIRHVRRDMVLKARYRVSGGGQLGASGVAKLLVKAEIAVESSLMAFGSSNKSTEVTIKRTVVNPTGQNRKFVGFKASRQYRGYWTRLYCQQHPLQDYPTWSKLGTGSWRSHERLEEGTIRCAAGYPGAVARFVARRHCG